MNDYINIRILLNSEYETTTLMNELFSRLHVALVKSGHGEIAISFPGVHHNLGDVIRLHGSDSSLKRLMSNPWYSSLSDYIEISDVHPIPSLVAFRVVKRVQSKSNSDRLKRRSIKKGWLTEIEADTKITSSKETKLSLPYVRLKSHSTKQPFRLFIEHGPLLPNCVQGSFSAYGLSQVATIPWF